MLKGSVTIPIILSLFIGLLDFFSKVFGQSYIFLCYSFLYHGMETGESRRHKTECKISPKLIEGDSDEEALSQNPKIEIRK